jgi:hypothetical protein
MSLSTLRTVSAVLLLTGTALVGTAAPALAEEQVCRGTIGAVTLDNLRVPQGAACTLEGTRLKGTIKVETRAVLRATAVHVTGNIQAEGARDVGVFDSRVGGSVQLGQGGVADIRRNTVTGNISLKSNRGPLTAASNRVGGDLQAFQNTGGLTVSTNRMAGNLQCKENEPAPTGGGNIVQGNKEDQCRLL